MSFKLNTTLTPFSDRTGNYAEVIAIVKNKLVLLYTDAQTDTVTDLDTAINLSVGSKVYFNSEGDYDPSIKSEPLKSGSSGSSKQSPSVGLKDPSSRY